MEQTAYSAVNHMFLSTPNWLTEPHVPCDAYLAHWTQIFTI